MEILKLVCLNWHSQEREKHIWEDRSCAPWDEIIGRIYLLKAHEALEEKHPYAEVLNDFEQALSLLANEGVHKEYFCRALADKALIQCFLGQSEVARTTIEQALLLAKLSYDRDAIMDTQGAILVLEGAFADALDLLQARLLLAPKDHDLRFTLATCLLHLERYQDAIAMYEQAIAEGSNFRGHDEGLKAARLGQQPDWANLSFVRRGY